MRKFKAIIIAVTATMALSACTNQNKAANKEAKIGRKQLSAFLTNQPVPVFPNSQLRQNLIEIETAQAHSTVTTSFMFNQGVQDPVSVCPSIGFPIASTSQLTNPMYRVQDHDATLPQIEANGIYTGDSSGTYVICVDGNGAAYAQYWEGFVSTVTGPAKWDTATHAIVLTGAPSAEFSDGQGG